MRSTKIFGILFFAVTLLATSCTKDDNSNNNSGNNNANVTPAAGQWKISYFFDKQEETSNYTGYTFDFAANGTLTTQGNGQTYTGTWQTNVDDSKDKFVINYTGTVPSTLQELEEDWLILVIDNNLMHFEHTSGGNGDTDVVKFVK
jgi:hypothetical protein